MIANKSIHTDLTKILLCPIILQILKDRPNHGYDILLTIQKNFGVRFAASSIYPLLSKLEKDHWLKSSWVMTKNRPQRVYQLTSKGEAVLECSLDSLQSFCKNFNKRLKDDKV